MNSSEQQWKLVAVQLMAVDCGSRNLLGNQRWELNVAA